MTLGPCPPRQDDKILLRCGSLMNIVLVRLTRLAYSDF